MASPITRIAAEFEVLVERASRLGHLNPTELVQSYRLLAPASHALLNDPRRVDLDALATALSSLPPDFLDAPRLFLVPRLELFAHTPIPSVVFPAGRLDDGTLLIECRFGHISLVNLAASLAAITLEVEKSRALCNVAGADVTSQAALAFTLGVDETGLLQAHQASGGTLLPLLTGDKPLPDVQIHPSLTTESVSERATLKAQRVLGRLAEMGLIGRRLHLWIGSSVVTECLSPYGRDLRKVLERWAEANPSSVGDDIAATGAAAGEDLTYALAHDFLRTDPNLKRERADADRTVGILRDEGDDADFEIIDLGRVDPAVADARLSPWRFDSAAPVLIRIGLDAEDEEAAGLKTLLQPLAAQLDSVSILLDGMAISGQIGAIILPQLLVRWAGEEKVTVPGATPLNPDDVLSFANAVVTQGAVLSVPSASLLSPSLIMDLTRSFGVSALSVGGAGLVKCLADARWSGLLPAVATLTWSLVSTRFASTGRPDLASLGAQSAVAVRIKA